MSHLIIHIGMPKTGSASIQETLFAKAEHEGWRYADLGVVNHSRILQSVFSTHPLALRGHQAVGSRLAESKKVNDRFEKQLEELKVSAGRQILSGEGVFNIDEAGLERLRAYFQETFDTIDIVGYIRPPASFMASAFVQLVKNHGQARLDFQKLWPRYRAKLEKFDRVFGRERVTLRAFDPQELADGDVVQDFCRFLGAPIAPGAVRRVNESLSLEATAALFVYRREGPCYQADHGKAADNNRLVNLLATFGGRKLRFADTLVKPVIEREAADLEWIESRLGVPLRDAGSTDAGAINCEQDLIDVAEQSREKLSDFVREQTQQVDPTPQRIANWMEKLRVTVTGRASNGVTPPPHEGTQFFTPEQVRRLTGKKMGPAAALRELAVAYERKGLSDEALMYARAALKLRPDLPHLRQLNERISSKISKKVELNARRGAPRVVHLGEKKLSSFAEKKHFSELVRSTEDRVLRFYNHKDSENTLPLNDFGEDEYLLMLKDATLYPRGSHVDNDAFSGSSRHVRSKDGRQLHFKKNANLLVTGDGYLISDSFTRYRFISPALNQKDKGWSFRFSGEISRLKGLFVYVDLFCGHFGHALLDTPARLWVLLGKMGVELDNVKFIGYGTHECHGKAVAQWPQWLFEFLKALGVNKENIVTVKSPTIVENLIVPKRITPLYSNTEAYQFFDVLRLAGDRLLKDGRGEGVEKVYLSRSRVSSDNRPLDKNVEEELELLFESYGFKVVHPQELPLSSQVAIVRNARYVAGPVGSQLHLLAFGAQPGVKVLRIAPQFFAPDTDKKIVKGVGGVLTDFVVDVKKDSEKKAFESSWSLTQEDVRKLDDCIFGWTHS